MIRYPAICLPAMILALYLLFGDGLASRDLWSSHEARAAMNAWSLAFGNGPPGVPYLFDGTPELQKPPLYYALAALIGGCCGRIDALVVRLPATLSALACLALLGFWLARQRRRPLLALITVTVLATGVHFILLARTARIDMPLALTTLAGFLGLIEAANNENRRGWLLLAYLGIAAGILLKGPIALALLLAALLPWFLIDRQETIRALILRWKPWWGIPLVVLLVVPWVGWINQATQGEFFRVFLWEHNLERGLGTGRLRSYPGWYYLPLLALNFLPWSPLLAITLVLAVRRGWARLDPEFRLALSALGGMLGLLSLAAFKRADYLAPLYPPAAIVVAVGLERLLRARFPVQALRVSLTSCLAVLLLVGLGHAIYARTELARVEPRREQAAFARTILAHRFPDEPILQFQTECHLLAYHLGPGREILVEWKSLAERVHRVESLLVVTTVHTAETFLRRLDGLSAERLADNGKHDRPLVLLRLRSRTSTLPCLTSPFSQPLPTNP